MRNWFQRLAAVAWLCALLSLSMYAVAQDLYVASNGNGSIIKVSIIGADFGVFTSGLSGPGLEAFDAAQNLLVTNFNNNTVVKIAPDGANLGVFASSGLSGPGCIAIDAQGNVYVGNDGPYPQLTGTTIRWFTSAGGDMGNFVSTGVSGPAAIVFDRHGNLYVSNYSGGAGTTVSEFSPTGAYLGAFASTGLIGPQGMAFDTSGNLYVVSFVGGNIRKFSPTGTDLGDFVSGLYQPSGVAFDAAGNLYVSLFANAGGESGGKVEKFSPTGQDLGPFVTSDDGIVNPIGIVFDETTIYGNVQLQGAVVATQTLTFEFWPKDGGAEFVRYATLQSDGTCIITNVPPGTYNVGIVGPRYLQRVVPLTVTSSTNSTFSTQLLVGDVNGDNVVDITDFSLLAAAFGSSPVSPNWNSNADLNNDGVVDIQDFSLLAMNFGLAGDPDPPPGPSARHRQRR